MSDLTPAYEPETGQWIIEGRQAGPAGEAGLVPVAGVDLAFDRADGHLVRVIVDCGNPLTAELLTRLFGPQAAELRCAEGRTARPGALSPEAALCVALSSLARLDAARATSPVPASSPWWAAEAAVLAERAGLHARALAEARLAVRSLGYGELAAPREAAVMAIAAADIAAAADGGEAARRLRASLAVSQPGQQPRGPGLDVAAEVANLAKDCVGVPGPQQLLDLALVPGGLFRLGLSPCSDLAVRQDRGGGSITVQAVLLPGADPAAVERCQARLVDPGVRRVLAQAQFHQDGSLAWAELCLEAPPDEPGETWVEVTGPGSRPVRSAKAHIIQRALRWADAALRAERAPAGIASRTSRADWGALAAAAWERCRRDWAAAGDPDRAAAAAAATLQAAPGGGLPGPVCLAEVLGA